MRKKKVVIVAENLYGGGVQRILQIICTYFDRTRFDLVLCSFLKDNPHAPEYPEDISYKFIFDRFSDDDSWLRKFKVRIFNKLKLLIYNNCSPHLFFKMFVQEKADVAIAFIEGYATRVVAGFPTATKKLAWLHIELINFHWSKIAYNSLKDEENAYRSMAKIICVAEQVKLQVDKIFPVADKTIVLHNPIDRYKIIEQANIYMPQLSKKKYEHRVVTIGSLDVRKGHDRLLRITKRLKNEGIDYELWILGQGDKYQELIDFINANQMKDRVFMFGFQANPFPYIKNSDMYVCASYAEGYNTAITEALVLGKPVVSTECSGVKEQLGEHNEYGICTPNTEEGLYEGIKKMLSGNILAHYTRQAEIRGRDFTLEKSMNEIYKLIDE